MKKLLSLVAIAAFMLAMAGCAVNANTGAIVVTNNTDKALNGGKIGTVSVGYVGVGTTVTVHFFKDEDSAKIDFSGFEPLANFFVPNPKGEINLKKNYTYRVSLMKDNGSYKYSASGSPLNYDNTTSSTTELESMK